MVLNSKDISKAIKNWTQPHLSRSKWLTWGIIFQVTWYHSRPITYNRQFSIGVPNIWGKRIWSRSTAYWMSTWTKTKTRIVTLRSWKVQRLRKEITSWWLTRENMNGWERRAKITAWWKDPMNIKGEPKAIPTSSKSSSSWHKSSKSYRRNLSNVDTHFFVKNICCHGQQLWILGFSKKA